MVRALRVGCLIVLASSGWAWGSEVSGRLILPEACAPEISPAVVWLVPGGFPVPSDEGPAPEVRLINQKMLQFSPRVQALFLGQGLRFANGDTETHNVHIQAPGENFNQSIGPGQTVEYRPRKPGLLRLVCDVHSSMRGFVLVAPSPWFALTDRQGRFRIADVPEGSYELHVWQEIGAPIVKEVEVGPSGLDVGTLTLQSTSAGVAANGPARAEPWPSVIDHVATTLAAALDAARRPEGAVRAVTRVDDAYFGAFEASDFEPAVRSYLGFERTRQLEQQFRTLRGLARDVAEDRAPRARFIAASRTLLLDLLAAARDLNAKGISDRSRVLATAAAVDSGIVVEGDRGAQLVALKAAFDRVGALADRGQKEAAASELLTAYLETFEPLELRLHLGNPAAVRPLEGRFSSLRTRIGAGLSGPELGSELDGLRETIAREVEETEASTSGAFGLAFAASFGTILREGLEVILILTMLAALVAKAGAPRARRALIWGVGLAVVASLATAIGLNLMVSTARGRSRELIEAAVMLAASGVLFSVSYWLIAQSQARRWMDFLKRHARRGAELGGFGTLGLTAFLAVYREGAETALMYQALLGGQGSRGGQLGVVAGLLLGLVVLLILYMIIRASSVRLPMRAFFQVTGILLFGLAIVFAGDGVFELQAAGVLKSTPVSWLGRGFAPLGIYPTAQGLQVQGLLLLGAAAALMLLNVKPPADRRPENAADPATLSAADRQRDQDSPLRNENVADLAESSAVPPIKPARLGA